MTVSVFRQCRGVSGGLTRQNKENHFLNLLITSPIFLNIFILETTKWVLYLQNATYSAVSRFFLTYWTFMQFGPADWHFLQNVFECMKSVWPFIKISDWIGPFCATPSIYWYIVMGEEGEGVSLYFVLLPLFLIFLVCPHPISPRNRRSHNLIMIELVQSFVIFFDTILERKFVMGGGLAFKTSLGGYLRKRCHTKFKNCDTL